MANSIVSKSYLCSSIAACIAFATSSGGFAKAPHPKAPKIITSDFAQLAMSKTRFILFLYISNNFLSVTFFFQFLSYYDIYLKFGAAQLITSTSNQSFSDKRTGLAVSLLNTVTSHVCMQSSL